MSSLPNPWPQFLGLLLGAALPGLLHADAGAGLVWAVNVGGPDYLAGDGTAFSGEIAVSGGEAAATEAVLGSQDPLLYQTYRMGELRIDRPMANGSYDLTFHFAEPFDIQAGGRVFDVFAERQKVIPALDVMLERDGQVRSALTVTVPGVRVEDGQLNVRLASVRALPVMSALVVRTASPRNQAWELIWFDEFDQPGPPDPERWNIDVWPARVVNDEDQAYTARPENLRVEEGHLVIEGRKEAYQEADYTSGRIHSLGKGDFLYGRVEARAWVPAAAGTWSAIWMLPSDPFRYASTCAAGDAWQGVETCDAWPNSGEIDILEYVGNIAGHVHGTVHNRAFYWRNWQQRKGRIVVPGVVERFAVYAMEWSPERIDLFVDDVLYFTYINQGDGWRAWPYDHPFHLVLNLAIGGAWGRDRGGIDDVALPQRMLVDFVRVYRLASP